MGFEEKITTQQKAYIGDLMRREGYDTRTVTYRHRLLGVPEAMQGGSVDRWLDGLTRQQASNVIRKLNED